MTGLLFSALFQFTGNFFEFSCKLKKPSGQDRTAAEGNYVAFATHRRRILSDVCEKMEKELRFVRIRALNRAANRDRTGTGITTHGILSPGRLPVPPLRHMDGDGFEPSKQFAADLQSVPFGHSGIRPCILFCVRMTSDID